MSIPILELKNIRHRFPDSGWELNINRFTISLGKILGIIGPNGSGKTTLLRIAAGILLPLEGTVHLSSRPLNDQDRKSIARNLGYLPQELSSEYDISVEELVRMGRYPHTKGIGTLSHYDLDAVRRSLMLTEMEAICKRPLSRLSGGEKKRAFLASVLAQEPKFLLLDEPTSALDIHYQVQFFKLLNSLARSGMGISVVTHEINLASLFSDSLVLLAGGKCFAEGQAEQVISPENMNLVYGEEILTRKHPAVDRPIILPRASIKKGP